MAKLDYSQFNIARVNWIPGPWDAEDDREEWTSAGGSQCILQRSQLGEWCGWVKFPTEGIPDEALGSIVVYGVPLLGCPTGAEGKWIGFSCSRPGDLIPGMMKWKRESLAEGVYRDFDFARQETEKLAVQVEEATAA